MTYTQAAVERAMKVHEVLMQALNGRQPWIDRAGWAVYTPTSGTAPDRTKLTQVGRALDVLIIV